MELFMTSAIIVTLFTLSARHFVDMYRGMGKPELKVRIVPYVMISSIFYLFTGYITASLTLEFVSFGLVVALVPMLVISFTLSTDMQVKISAFAAIGMELLLGILNLIMTDAFHSDGCFSGTMIRLAVKSCTVCLTVLYAYGIWLRLKNIKSVMRLGSPWTTVCICVDSIYLLFFVSATYVLCEEGMMTAYTVYLIFSLVALSSRVRNSSTFVLWTEHENRIIESMKITQLEAFSESPGADILYKGIYDRVLEHFERTKPYLNNDLTINDVVEVVFANKLYISRAISHYTGRNFCQFVNYYRVCHAIEMFRENPRLKIVDMANKSGFNSAVSFSTAFRLFMGEKPGDWCRKEKVRLSKHKK